MRMKAKGEKVIGSIQTVPFLVPLPRVELLDLFGQLRNPRPRSPQTKHPVPEVVVLPSELWAANSGFGDAVHLGDDAVPKPLPFFPFFPLHKPFLLSSCHLLQPRPASALSSSRSVGVSLQQLLFLIFQGGSHLRISANCSLRPALTVG